MGHYALYFYAFTTLNAKKIKSFLVIKPLSRKLSTKGFIVLTVSNDILWITFHFLWATYLLSLCKRTLAFLMISFCNKKI